MGPPIFIGGNSQLRLSYPLLTIASMGPPIFIGGNVPALERRNICSGASMGPPIFIGGNTSSSCPFCCCLLGFNGAADFHRRKYSSRGDGRQHRRSASMGPPIFIGGNRPCGLGNMRNNKRFNGAADFHRRKFVRVACPSSHQGELQWGRRFSSAEILFDYVTKRGFQELQWGRRFSSAEMKQQQKGIEMTYDASMGPPIFIGGNAAAGRPGQTKQTCFNGAADFHRRK